MGDPEMFDARQVARLDIATRSLVFGGASICLVAALTTSRRFDLADTVPPLLSLLAMAVIAIVYGRFRPAPRIAAAAAMTADFVAYGLVFGSISYLAVSIGRPNTGFRLAGLDAALGFDWRAYVDTVRATPLLATPLWLGYVSMIPQLGVLAVLLAWQGRFGWLRILLDAFALCALTAIAISALLPAVDADVVFGAVAPLKAADGWHSGVLRIDHFLGLHDGSLLRIPVMESTGIVTFPSFHTMCGVLFAICFAQYRMLRWPAVVLNGLLIAATPVEGGHYLIDALAGVALAVAIIGLVLAWCASPPQKAGQAAI